jgi:hypothetical protein
VVLRVDASGKTEDIHVPRTKKRGVTAGSLRQVPAARNSTTIATVFSTELLCHSIKIIPLLAGARWILPPRLVGPNGRIYKSLQVAFSVHNEHLLRMELYNVNICICDYRVSLSVPDSASSGFVFYKRAGNISLLVQYTVCIFYVLCLYNKKERTILKGSGAKSFVIKKTASYLCLLHIIRNLSYFCIRFLSNFCTKYIIFTQSFGNCRLHLKLSIKIVLTLQINM